MKFSELCNILLSSNASDLIRLNEDKVFELIPELKVCKGFEQKSKWHVFDVYEHILHVIDGVDNDLTLRIVALFHDIGKPKAFTMDEEGNGHFYKHWDYSLEIFNNFISKYDISNKELIGKLIKYHDIRIEKLNKEELNKFLEVFSYDEINMLYKIKRADLLAQNSIYHYMIDDLNEENAMVLKLYK